MNIKSVGSLLEKGTKYFLETSNSESIKEDMPYIYYGETDPQLVDYFLIFNNGDIILDAGDILSIRVNQSITSLPFS